MSKTREPKPITFDELMAETEKYRKVPSRREFTPDQDKFIMLCRVHAAPVPFPDIARLWKRAGWGPIGEDSVRRRYNKLKERG